MRKKYGRPSFDPIKALEGYTDSPVWLVGLNPYHEQQDPTTPNPMGWISNVSSSHDWDRIPHFSRLKTVLGPYFDRLGQKKGIASTDIVKCASKSFVRNGTEGQAVFHCRGFLYRQLESYRPRLIIVLGSAGSRYIEELNATKNRTAAHCACSLTPHSGESTIVKMEKEVKPKGELTLSPSGHTLRYVLSGYTGHQMERYAKARLAVDVQLELAEVFGPPPTASEKTVSTPTSNI